MMFKTHVAFGFLAGLLCLKFFSVSNPILFITLVVLASALPDIDHPNSKLGSKFRIIGFLFEHRGFFHSVFPAIVLFAVLWYANLMIIGLPLTIGYVVHLASDCLTRLGCNLLYPVSTFRIQGFVMTDGLMEFLIFAGVSVADASLLFLKFRIL